MSTAPFKLAAVVGLGLALASCTVHQTSTPAVSGPSVFALSLSLTATPNTLTLDGFSRATVLITARDDKGNPQANLQLRLDEQVGSGLADCGTLSTKSPTTGTDGTATVVFTAPSLPLPFPQCAGFSLGGQVAIIASPVSNTQPTNSVQAAFIRMVPSGVIVPPADTPTAVFTFTPSPPVQGSPAQFDGSTSCGGPISNSVCSSTSKIITYAWSFGDGATATGEVAGHTYITQQTFAVTLTVTNDRGMSASSTQSVSVSAQAVQTTAKFETSPTAPVVNQAVVFDASESTTATGLTIVDYAWTFGDSTATVHTSTNVVSHAYAIAGEYTPTLTIKDSVGVTSTTTGDVIVSGAGLPTASFTISASPAKSGSAVSFDGSQSVSPTGTIVHWEWDFGDGTPAVGDNDPFIDHTFATAGNVTVTLTVTDSSGKQGSTTRALVVQ